MQGVIVKNQIIQVITFITFILCVSVYALLAKYVVEMLGSRNSTGKGQQ